MGLGEIILIVIVALLFIGPEKLPEAAKSLSKGIRDLRKQTRELRDTIEEDTEFGGAIRDLQSALRGDELHPNHARQKAAALSKSKSPTLKPAPEASAASSAPASSAGATAGAAAPVPAPVIAASAGAVARAGSTEPADPAATAGEPAATAGEPAAGAEKQPDESAADSTSAPGRAHG